MTQMTFLVGFGFSFFLIGGEPGIIEALLSSSFFLVMLSSSKSIPPSLIDRDGWFKCQRVDRAVLFPGDCP